METSAFARGFVDLLYRVYSGVVRSATNSQSHRPPFSLNRTDIPFSSHGGDGPSGINLTIGRFKRGLASNMQPAASRSKGTGFHLCPRQPGPRQHLHSLEETAP